jgi:hypothetical protein
MAMHFLYLIPFGFGFFTIDKDLFIYCMVDNNNVKLITTSHKSLSIVKKPKPKGIKYRKCMAIVNSKYK